MKLNANFPNTIYLLAADRDVIKKSLESEQNISGRAYLEKIVQAGFDIPPIDGAYISRLLTEEINKALSNYGGPFNQSRWIDIYQAGFRQFFSNLRDIKRFSNSFAFNFLMVSTEVCVEDFIVLEAIRVFSPAIYNGIATNKRLFTLLWQPGRQEELQPSFNAVFSLDKKYEAVCKQLAIQLFPQLKSIYGNTMYLASHQQEWRNEKRICTPEYFDTYFLLGVPVGEVSEAELNQLIVSATDFTQLKDLFTSIVLSGRSRRLLEKIDNVLERLSPITSKSFAALLLELGDELPDESTGFFDIGSVWTTVRLVYCLLWRIEEQEHCQWLQDEIRTRASLGTALQQIEVAESKLQKDADEIIFDEPCIYSLKQTWIARVQEEAISLQLEQKEHLGYILTTWRAWFPTDDIALTNFVDHATETSEKTVKFLAGFAKRTGSYIGNVHTIQWRIDLKRLEQVLTPIALSLKLAQLPEDIPLFLETLSQKEREALLSFVKEFQPSQTVQEEE